MAKKTAPKKKSATAKSKTTMPVKAVKAVKAVKNDKKVTKAVKADTKPQKSTPAKPAKVEKPIKASKPALMTKGGKKAAALEGEDLQSESSKKSQTIVSMIETDTTQAESTKAEKVSKAKPIKIERGNLADEKAKWVELNKKFGKEKALAYKMTESYPSLVPMQHKVLGWGYILSNENDRLEVLFENGIRMLISNYKS